MKIIQAKVYTFDELSDKAKAKAINNYHQELAWLDFKADLEMIMDNAIDVLKEKGIETMDTDYECSEGYWSFFGIKAHTTFFDKFTQPIIDKWLEEFDELSDIEWSFNIDMIKYGGRGTTNLYKDTIDVTIYDYNYGVSSSKLQDRIPAIKESILDAMEQPFNSIMDVLEQAYIDMKEDYNYRFSDEYIVDLYTEEEYYFNTCGELINVDVLQPV